QALGEDEFIFNARADLDDVSDLLGVVLPSEGGDTLGGFIYSQLGRVPEVGDEVTFDGLVMSVLAVEGQRITQVHVIRNKSEEAAGDQDEPNTRDDVKATSLFSFLTFWL
ncbi:MAG TPA: hypothetical protein EYP04_02960, partial [Anaerolineae bacterium]|nr:hypothetical protein [Anaerolineae bacterium]